ncbi:MAG: type IV toxin-antitoxin system AbiEi family antitoxin domain-containing protein [Nanoarchaeota archaeon]|nr:type IV toxin-antitoxin system AbiEi family antitoxin domain-containing protein [Nanoarchaeota archaeon]
MRKKRVQKVNMLKSSKSSKKRDDLPPILKATLQHLMVYPLISYVVKKTGRDKRLVARDLKRLIEKGYLERIDRGVYKVIKNVRGVGQSHQNDNLKDHCRLHLLEIRLNVNSDIHRMIKATVLKKREFYNVRENRAGLYMDYLVTGLITREHVYFKFPEGWEITGSDIMDIGSKLYQEIQNTVQKWENRFKVNLFKHDRVNFDIRNMHIAIMHNGIVQEYKKQGINYLVVHDEEDGKPRYLFDWSKGVAELEAVHPEKGFDDTDRAKYFLHTLKDGRYENMINKHEDFFTHKERISLSDIMHIVATIIQQNKESTKINYETAAGLKSVVDLMKKETINPEEKIQNDIPDYIF